ncbi:HAMP domain-containing protein [Novosphingobium umbonatum]|uniref:histidine kinase n=1 Tax=Novosphingobium umbonatum TaxID=1908524 RepID=A0A437N0D6_9SPHN|nr:ATP-binding protein [Novosphingobium umbonatum]RVU03386.1 HAMP domain-containing protein [Novosphingobium umbonatum]
MKIRFDLSRHLTLAMAAVAISTVLISFVVFYGVYTVAVWCAPQLFPPGFSALPSGWDLAIMGVVTIMGVGLGALIAARIARCIVEPMHAVGGAARKIADGDLSARAASKVKAPGETAMLLEDFNTMAGRLEKAAHDAVSWNAQIAHELRTPLTILKGRLQGVSDGVFIMDDALLRGLLTQVDGLARLVEDLRCVSLADIGRLELRLADVDIYAELQDWVVMMQPSVERFGFSLVLEGAPLRVRVDMERLRQALLALVDNALHYAMPCLLRLRIVSVGAGFAIHLADEGPGVPEDQRADLFRVFTRGDTAREAHRTGSGLGLAVVQAIAQAHGGRAEYKSISGVSEFVICCAG